jgi:hypothetical protein
MKRRKRNIEIKVKLDKKNLILQKNSAYLTSLKILAAGAVSLATTSCV